MDRYLQYSYTVFICAHALNIDAVHQIWNLLISDSISVRFTHSAYPFALSTPVVHNMFDIFACAIFRKIIKDERDVHPYRRLLGVDFRIQMLVYAAYLKLHLYLQSQLHRTQTWKNALKNTSITKIYLQFLFCRGKNPK